MELSRLWFDTDNIYIEDVSGRVLQQSLLWYDKLRQATPEQRSHYTVGFDGIHWRELDEDVSFESFEYDDAEPTRLQRFFLTHREVDIDGIAQHVGVTSHDLHRYINGFDTPSKECESMVMEAAEEYSRML